MTRRWMWTGSKIIFTGLMTIIVLATGLPRACAPEDFNYSPYHDN